MTIITEQTHEARAKRRNDPSFRLAGGPLPRGKPIPFPIDPEKQEEPSNTNGSGLQ